MEMGEMYMKHTNYNETGILPTIADMENSLLERNMAATTRQIASQKQGRWVPKTPACCLKSHPLTTLLICLESTQSEHLVQWRGQDQEL